ncbi:MAG: nitrilase-related carbon-nitrogen hydrolase [Hyphomonadaceae bacterium]
MTRHDVKVGSYVREDGTYPTVPLRKTERVDRAGADAFARCRWRRSEAGPQGKPSVHLDRIDWAQRSGPCDLLCFHEFPIQGYRNYDREQSVRVAFEEGCDEVEAVAKKAKQWNCYITMGSLWKDKDWPGHSMNMQLLFGPSGELVAKHWKQRAKRGTRQTREQFTTCIYDVFDRYVEMYGWDAVIPVARTDIGNISMSAVQYEPELFRAMTMKGCGDASAAAPPAASAGRTSRCAPITTTSSSRW